MTKHPEQVRLETALRVARADSEAPALAFRFVLGCYRDGLGAQGAGFTVDWPAMAESLIPQLKVTDDEFSTTNRRGNRSESDHGELDSEWPLCRPPGNEGESNG